MTKQNQPRTVMKVSSGLECTTDMPTSEGESNVTSEVTWYGGMVCGEGYGMGGCGVGGGCGWDGVPETMQSSEDMVAHIEQHMPSAPHTGLTPC